MSTEAVTPETRWIAWLSTTPDARRALRAFAPHYFFFSYRQVVAFSALFKQIDPLDRKSLAMLADVLHEELGRGSVDRVHSKLFERFASALDLAPEDLLLEVSQVLPGVRAYVGELERAFDSGSVPEALATYVFLESSAVDTYGPLVEALRTVGFTDEDVEFFELHAGVEVEHAAAADAMLRRYKLDAEDPVVRAQQEKLARLWHSFWSEIDEVCRRAVAA
jgi:pyrroloquinoline quinone (PQQ) biosynthesis protein C